MCGMVYRDMCYANERYRMAKMVCNACVCFLKFNEELYVCFSLGPCMLLIINCMCNINLVVIFWWLLLYNNDTGLSAENVQLICLKIVTGIEVKKRSFFLLKITVRVVCWKMQLFFE